jgi:hypothetical protein
MTAATLVLAVVAVALLIAIVALVAGTRKAIADTRRELELLGREFTAGRRPILADVLDNAPVPSGMEDETRFPGLERRPVDPRAVFVAFGSGKLYLSVPLRNIGESLALMDGSGVTLSGPLVGEVEYRSVQREHVPVNETTRVDLIAALRTETASDAGDEEPTRRGIAWRLTIPYCDVSGNQRAVAQLQIGSRGDDVNGPWRVERVEHDIPRVQVTPVDDTQGQSSSDRTDAGPPRPGVRNEPVVDLWGNPVRPKGRSR